MKIRKKVVEKLKAKRVSKNRAIKKAKVEAKSKKSAPSAPKAKARKVSAKSARKKCKVHRKWRTVVKTEATIEKPVVVPVEFALPERWPAVVMVPRTLPGTQQMGPFTEIVVPLQPRPKPRVWVRVIAGDDKNGQGILIVGHPRVDIPKGMKVRFAGGTDQSPARMIEPQVGYQKDMPAVVASVRS